MWGGHTSVHANARMQPALKTKLGHQSVPKTGKKKAFGKADSCAYSTASIKYPHRENGGI